MKWVENDFTIAHWQQMNQSTRLPPDYLLLYCNKAVAFSAFSQDEVAAVYTIPNRYHPILLAHPAVVEVDAATRN